MPSVTAVVTGHRRIDRVLKQLPLRIQKKVARQAMRAGMKLVAAEVKAEAPVDQGTLRRAVIVRVLKKQKRGSIAMEVRINPAKTKKTTKSGKTYFIPALIQFGRSGVAPNAFGTRAFNSGGRPARDVTLQALLDGALREARKP